MKKRVLFVTTELYPYVKTGGLGDVSGALPLALSNNETDVRIFVPGYTAILKSLANVTVIKTFTSYFGADDVRLLLGTLSNGMTAYVLSSPGFYERSGPYVDANGRDWADNHLRFAAFSRTAADLYLYDPAWQPDVIHGNDWQTGLIPAYLAFREGPVPATALTIHNLAYQGLFPAHVLTQIGLPPESFSINGVEFHGQVSYLKAGLFYANKLSTVSPTYAHEIQTPEYGCGMDGLLRSRASDLTGILNGIDQEVWNPMTDPYLASRYGADKLEARERNKKALLNTVGLPQSDNPAFAVVGRMTHQKGFDLMLQAAPNVLSRKASLIFMGQGDAKIENQVKDLEHKYPGQVAAHIGYSETLEHMMHGGADAIVMPSRFEPCGLVQMYGLRYGAVPIVRRTGGLADTVQDTGKSLSQAGTGLVFDKATPDSLQKSLGRTMDFYGNRRLWRRIQRNAMAKDFSWDVAAGKYRAFYEETTAH